MNHEERLKKISSLAQQVVNLTLVIALISAGLISYYLMDPQLSAVSGFFREEEQTTVASIPSTGIVDGIHVETGLVEGEGLMTVVNNCTNCHSAQLVMQNRMNAARWNETIKWMQETQGLWELGENQEVIVNYLVTNYPPKKKGRREQLVIDEWYELEQ